MFVILIAVITNISVRLRTIIFASIQLIYTVYLLIVRTYVLVKDNIIE